MTATKTPAMPTPGHSPCGGLVRTLMPVIIVGAVVAVYASSFSGVFLLDDHHSIENNQRIHQLWPLSQVLSHRRPVVDLVLAINYALGGVNVWGYHAVNLAVHAIAALTLFGIVRRTLSSEMFHDTLRPSAPYFALAVALIWAVHPLNTQSVTYVIQRCESMMGMFYLLTLYCFIRGVQSSASVRWHVAAVFSCALGMGCKAVMASAPLVVFLYDYTFVARSFRVALRRRCALYVGLLATCGILWFSGTIPAVFSTSQARHTVGFSLTTVSPLEYALTQPGVILYYIRLSLWPHPLCLDYGWPTARTFMEIVPPAAVVLAAVAGTVWALLRRHWVGFIGAWFLLILAPTSSFIPIKDLLFEHRMYLPLISIVVLLVTAGRVGLLHIGNWAHLSDRRRRVLGTALVAAIVVPLGHETIRRNRDYYDEIEMWQDVVAKRPLNYRGNYNLGTYLLRSNELEGALASLGRALEINPRSFKAQYNMGKALAGMGRTDEAARHYMNALQLNPEMATAHIDLGDILAKRGWTRQAIRHYRQAIKAKPRYALAYFNLGILLLKRGAVDEAAEELEHAASLDPGMPKVHYFLGNAYLRKGKRLKAISEYRRTLAIDPTHAGARKALNNVIAGQNKVREP